MRIYLAAALGTNEYMRQIRDSLRIMGHGVTSRWIDAGMKDLEDMHAGMKDLEDIDASEALACFTEVPSTTGGYYHEFGYAMGRPRKIELFVVGPVRNIFMMQPGVQVFATDTEFLTVMNSGLHLHTGRNARIR